MFVSSIMRIFIDELAQCAGTDRVFVQTLCVEKNRGNKCQKVQQEQLTLAIDEKTGDYTRLASVKAGGDTAEFGGKSHPYPEEIYIISGRLYDAALCQWLETVHFASLPSGEIHGPFICEEECLVLEVSLPSQSINAT